MRAEVVTDLDRLQELAPSWDTLAVACDRPRSAPAWVLAWYRHCMAPGALIRGVFVTDGGALVGAVPLYVRRSGFGFYRYEMAAPVLFGVEPLCTPGLETEVAETVGAALATLRPTPDIVSLDWLRAGSSWTGDLRAGWSRPKPTLIYRHEFLAPRVLLEATDLDGWLAKRSKSFRKAFRNDHRKVLAAGFDHRVSTKIPDILDRLPALHMQYESRRAARGGAGTPFDDRFMEMVKDAVANSDEGRVCLATMEGPGDIVAIDLIIRSGREASVWFGGFDETRAHLGASRINLVLCLNDAIEAGDAAVDLGPGAETYKASYTDDAVTLQGTILARRGLRPLHTPAQLMPFAARQAAARVVGRLRNIGGGGNRPGPGDTSDQSA